MGLPHAREKTIIPGDPIDSQIVNTLQDAVKYGWRGPQTINLDILKFVPISGNWSFGISQQIVGSGFQDALVIGVDGLPAGATVTGFHVRVTDSSNSPGLRVQARFQAVDLLVHESSAMVESDGSGATQVIGLSNLAHVVHPRRRYWLYIRLIEEFGTGQCTIWDASLNYFKG